jgi:hypothetical protein
MRMFCMRGRLIKVRNPEDEVIVLEDGTDYFI